MDMILQDIRIILLVKSLISEITYYTHRLLPRLNSGGADFPTLRKYQNTSTDESTIFIMFDKIYTGLLCLHSNGIYHNDFELKNILVSSNGKIGIADFGVSRVIDGDFLLYGYSTIYDGFLKDLLTLGPMIGNFIDSDNIEPYQYRLDSGKVDNVPILNKIQTPELKDLFLLLTSFNDLVAFVSFICYVNKNIDIITCKTLIDDASELANFSIEELPFEDSEKETAYVRENHKSNILSTIYNTLIPDPGFKVVISYFRHIINKMLITAGATELLYMESVHDYVKRVFNSSYYTVIENLSNQLKYGFLLKHFDIFNKLYQ